MVSQSGYKSIIIFLGSASFLRYGFSETLKVWKLMGVGFSHFLAICLLVQDLCAELLKDLFLRMQSREYMEIRYAESRH